MRAAPDTGPHSHSLSRADSYPHSFSEHFPHGAATPHSDADSNSRASHPHSFSDTHADAFPYCDSNSNADSYAGPHSHSFSDADSDTYPNAHSQPYAYAYARAYRHRVYSNPRPDAHAHSDTHADADNPTVMNISVIHPARNENAEITATVDSMIAAGADEVLVYDDGSDTPLEFDPRTRHFRHAQSLGPSVCRNLGGKASVGDVLVFADAHTRIDDLRPICEEALARQCIMVPSMQSLNGSGEATGYGRGFILKGKEGELLGFDKTSRRPVTRYSFCGGNWGGFFIMPRSVFDRIGGWVNHSFWGYNDPSLILKAWLCGVPTILDRDTIYKHKGKAKTGFGYPVPAAGPFTNALQTFYVLFDEQTFQGHWLPLFSKHHKWIVNRAMDHVMSEEIQAERAAFQGLKQLSDEMFFSSWIPTLGFNGMECDAQLHSGS